MSKRPSFAEAETHDWWMKFLEARTYAIRCLVVLGKNDNDIMEALGFSDPHHVARIRAMNNIT